MLKFRIFLLFIIATVFTSCITEKSIEFKEVKNIRPERIGQETTIHLDVVFYNPNNWGCMISNTVADLSIDDRKVGTAKQLETVKMEPGSTVTIPCSFNTSGGELLRLIPSGIQVIFGGKKMTAVTKGTTTVKKMIFKKQIRFESKQELNGKLLQSIF